MSPSEEKNTPFEQDRVEPLPTTPVRSLPAWLPPLFFLLLAALFLWHSLFTGEVFLPTRLLGHVAPYSAVVPAEELPPWNPLRWDGIAQFYPWRHFAATTIRAGSLPLWNPYQFTGTPFVANSQSAVFYPGNLVFYLFTTATAFGLNALLHLTLCGWFTYLLLRRLKCSEFASLLSGVIYTFGAWQVAWLPLPTFLATSCWFPLLLRQIHILVRHEQRIPTSQAWRSAMGLGAIVGVMLLAGHLQIAFYGLLAGTLWAMALLVEAKKEGGWASFGRCLLRCVLALGIGFCVAMPQMLPSLELSRVSHRVGKPSSEGYRLYTEYALPPAGLSTLLLPEFFGNDYTQENSYWGFYTRHGSEGQTEAVRHNAAETANYVGVLPLLLAGLALWRGARGKERDKRVQFWGLMALLALLMALGTPVNSLFYFGVPGFGQSGSPGRVLVLWLLSVAILAGLGLDSLVKRTLKPKEIMGVLAIPLLLWGAGMLFANLDLALTMKGVSYPSFGEVLGRQGIGWIRLGLSLLVGILLFLPLLQKRALGIALVWGVVELFWAGMPVNPSGKTAYLYPVTEGIKLLQERVGHQRIAPVNTRWSLTDPPPAILPPNGAMVYGLRDVQGYDSLFTGQYKRFSNGFAVENRFGVRDSSPIQVGNMVFFQDVKSPEAGVTAASFALLPATSDKAFMPDLAPTGDPLFNRSKDCAIYTLPNAEPRARLIPAQNFSGKLPLPEWLEDGVTRVRLKVDSPIHTTLVLADQDYPGWVARVDGQSARIEHLKKAEIFRAVLVPPGSHEVTFTYEPQSFRAGLYLALFSSMLMAMTLGVTGMKKRLQ